MQFSKNPNLLSGENNSINMRTYSWKTGRMYAHLLREGCGEFKSILDVADTVTLAYKYQLVCEESGHLFPEEAVEAELRTGFVQHYIADKYIQKMCSASQNSLSSQNVVVGERSINDLDDVSPELKKNFLNSQKSLIFQITNY